MPEPTLDDPNDDEVSLRPYFEALWNYRSVIALSLLVWAIGFAIVAGVAYVVLPKERMGTVQFRLLFNGAEENQYPNGTPFNPNEIVASPVLSAVFDANDLKRYGGLDSFQQSMFVLQSNPALQELDRSYQAKLNDTKLTTVDRAKMEDEFFRKREAIRDPEFNLGFRRDDRVSELPAPLMEKVLSNTLETWAKQADAEKGAARPDVDLVSHEVFARAGLQSENFLVRIDVLRTGAQRLARALSALGAVGGAKAVRTKDNLTVSDELAQVENILKFDIDPLMGLARLAGTAQPDRLVLLAYISNQLVSYRLDFRAATSQAQNIQTSLREYMAQRGGRIETGLPGTGASGTTSGGPAAGVPLLPQIGDSFIDRLMEMSAATQAPEAEYRRSLTDRFIAASERATAAEREIGYYEDLLKQLSIASAPLGNPAGAEMITTRFNRVLESLNLSVDRLHLLYDTVALQTMNPSRRLYQITQPFRLVTISPVPLRSVLVAFVVTMLVGLVTTIAGVMAHFLRRRTPPGKPSRPTVNPVESRLGSQPTAQLT